MMSYLEMTPRDLPDSFLDPNQDFLIDLHICQSTEC